MEMTWVTGGPLCHELRKLGEPDGFGSQDGHDGLRDLLVLLRGDGDRLLPADTPDRDSSLGCCSRGHGVPPIPGRRAAQRTVRCNRLSDAPCSAIHRLSGAWCLEVTRVFLENLILRLWQSGPPCQTEQQENGQCDHRADRRLVVYGPTLLALPTPRG